jgi:hypothetical protein
MSEIKIFHMMDGKTVIAKVSYESSDVIVLEKPCEIVILPPGMGHNKTDKPQLFYAPYLTIMGALEPFDVLDVKPVHVVAIRDNVAKGIEDGYLQLTSGIALVTSL